MSAACCTATRANGDPCAAHPLADGEFCLFHAAARAESLAAGRSRGGAAPRRRVRRFPRVLDHLYVAGLLGELLIDALNDPEALDTKRLQALTNLCRVLLKAVGVPKDSPLVHEDRREPAAAEDHLLRVYPPLPADVEALVASETWTITEPEAMSVQTSERRCVQGGAEQAANKQRTGAPATDRASPPPPDPELLPNACRPPVPLPGN